MKLTIKCNFQMIDLIKLGVFSVCFFNFAVTTFAQGAFKFHVGPSFATADFGDDDAGDDDAGGAGIGLNAGLDYLYPLTETGLYLYSEVWMLITTV